MVVVDAATRSPSGETATAFAPGWSDEALRQVLAAQLQDGRAGVQRGRDPVGGQGQPRGDRGVATGKALRGHRDLPGERTAPGALRVVAGEPCLLSLVDRDARQHRGDKGHHHGRRQQRAAAPHAPAAEGGPALGLGPARVEVAALQRGQQDGAPVGQGGEAVVGRAAGDVPDDPSVLVPRGGGVAQLGLGSRSARASSIHRVSRGHAVSSDS